MWFYYSSVDTGLDTHIKQSDEEFLFRKHTFLRIKRFDDKNFNVKCMPAA